jgi:hypothetical protein
VTSFDATTMTEAVLINCSLRQATPSRRAGTQRSHCPGHRQPAIVKWSVLVVECRPDAVAVTSRV